MKHLSSIISKIILFFFFIISLSCEKEEQNEQPFCRITTPALDTIFVQGEMVEIIANIGDTDGEVIEVRVYIDNNLINTGSISNNSYKYEWITNQVELGDHEIRVEAIDNKNASAESEKTVTIVSNGLTADFTASKTIFPYTETVTFTDNTQGTPDSWQWDFGDNNYSAEQNPTHEYSRGGIYTVTLRVSNSINSDDLVKSDYITVQSEPIVTTNEAEAITSTTTTISGNISENGFSEVTARGVCWSTNQNPTINNNHTNDGTGIGNFTSNITGLTEWTKYYVRSYATNEVGTSYGNEVTIIANNPVVDIDGNSYQSVKIGNQIWMAGNLNVTHYADGTAITLNPSSWWNLAPTDKAMCYYNGYSSIGETYGALYTWAAAMNGAASSNANPSEVQGVCPTGWHLPSDAEFKELEMHLGMSQTDADATGYRGTNEGSKLAGNETKWLGNTTIESGNDFGSSGFHALPAGFRFYDGTFLVLGEAVYFWSTSEQDASNAWYRLLDNSNTGVYRNNSRKIQGVSVRCIKD